MHSGKFPSEETVERIRKTYPHGCCVELISMDDPYTKLPSGAQGTVTFVDSIGTVFVDWDCGSGLGAAHGKDRIKRL